MKNFLRKNTPQVFKDIRNNINKNKEMKKVVRNDIKRFKKHSFSSGKFNYSQLEGKLTKEYHSLEKGLSYNNLRLGFGKQVLQNIIQLMKQYREQGFPTDTHVYQTALSNLNEYIKIHQENNYDVSELNDTFNELKGQSEYTDTGGVKLISKDEVLKKSKENFKEFSLSRHSVRDYSEEPVSYEVIEQALNLASNTPSACNRQPWRVRVVESPELKKFIQNNQNGNRGFGDYIDKFLIITSDVHYYERSRERNQANIDGGMYAMNLLYALHYYEVATIPLSASLTIKQESNLREKFKISDAENFIMFLGVGNYTEEFKVPKSHRRPITYKKY